MASHDITFVQRTGSPQNEITQINNNLQVIKTALATLESALGGPDGFEIAWGDIVGNLDAQLDLLSRLNGANHVSLSAHTTLDFDDFVQDTSYSNTSAASVNLTVPTPAIADIGKSFSVCASTTFSLPIVIRHASFNGLLRDWNNTAGPFTVSDGTAVVTIASGLAGSPYYSVAGNFT